MFFIARYTDLELQFLNIVIDFNSKTNAVNNLFLLFFLQKLAFAHFNDCLFINLLYISCQSLQNNANSVKVFQSVVII